MAMVVCDKPCVSAGTFTTNVVKAACVQWDKKLVDEDNDLQAIVINTGIANACTGKEGFDICRAEAETVDSAEAQTADWRQGRRPQIAQKRYAW